MQDLLLYLLQLVQALKYENLKEIKEKIEETAPRRVSMSSSEVSSSSPEKERYLYRYR